MELTVTLTFDAAPDAVAAMLADAEFVRWRAAWSSGEGTVEQADVTRAADGGFTVSVRRTLPSALIPPQARAFVGDRLEIRQVEVWGPPVEGVRSGTVAIEITGAPVRVTGTVRLAAGADGGSAQTYTGEVRATVPLFGSMVEQAAASAVRDALHAEESAARAWLDAPAEA
ncbi:uncharacterized protein DUF2505 [Sediminihabitans luteus]|uniref:Uncharacterized protein DUF2505 n=1 Tax=Sediminihabitans luteus TaxID=1138585 RepID=A0A2M9CDF3_9CELL|nr:DUF2505 domain-containing protein [Sediminihabitans luteus]PJJ69961.1 uncharacterized protein DUF2505 [Sediminihabitans luteus]GII99281.1 hypothetical protein Slu03_16590 [Sediminihabitans luteus]